MLVPTLSDSILEQLLDVSPQDFGGPEMVYLTRKRLYNLFDWFRKGSSETFNVNLSRTSLALNSHILVHVSVWDKVHTGVLHMHT